jgi:hypothetical protein
MIISCTKNSIKAEDSRGIDPDVDMSVSSLDDTKDEHNYVFNYVPSGYFDDYPAVINKVQEQYPNESFEERVEAMDPIIRVGKYSYSLISPSIDLSFMGNTRDEATLGIVSIFNPIYQNEDIQIIGMSITEIKELLNTNKVQYRESDGIHAIVILFDDESHLGIKVENDIITSYSLIGSLNSIKSVLRMQDDEIVFDIDDFGFLSEFPATISGIKEKYPDEYFEFSTTKNGFDPTIAWGEYIYLLSSPDNIIFTLYGNSEEEARVYIARVLNPNYQCEKLQIIGASAEKIENISGKELDQDKCILISIEGYVLVIVTESGVVINYAVVAEY